MSEAQGRVCKEKKHGRYARASLKKPELFESRLHYVHDIVADGIEDEVADRV